MSNIFVARTDQGTLAISCDQGQYELVSSDWSVGGNQAVGLTLSQTDLDSLQDWITQMRSIHA